MNVYMEAQRTALLHHAKLHIVYAASDSVTGIAETIANADNEWGADLVVVGMSHRRGLERLVIGSVAEQLIAKVNASVLLIRPHQSAERANSCGPSR